MIMRPPVAPKGWPSGMLPPLTLRRDMSTRPIGLSRPSFSLHHSLDSMARIVESTWPANASWNSTMSKIFPLHSCALEAREAWRTGGADEQRLLFDIDSGGGVACGSRPGSAS